MGRFGNSRGGGGFGGGRRDSDRRSGGGRGFGGGRDSGRQEMFEATCDQCGKFCKVPFRPSGEKPVYCSECYEEISGENRNDRRSNRGESRGGRSNDRSGGFESRERSHGGPSSEQFDELNKKLDLILKALSNVVPRESKKKSKKSDTPEFEMEERKSVRVEEEGISLE